MRICILARMTKLAQHLSDRGITQEQFADQVGLDQSTISRLCRGTMTASLPTALKIQAWTEGAISVSDLVRQGAA